MRTRAAAVVLSVVLVTLAWAMPAGAKGATGGTIEGEGMDEGVAVSPDLTVQSGLYELIWESPGTTRLVEAPTSDLSDLGPRFVITWMLMGPNGDVPIEQEVYPYAAGGPVTYVAPGQAMWETASTLGGWSPTSKGFVTELEALGVSRPVVSAAGKRGTDWAPIGASVAAMLLLGGGLARFSRRRGEVAPAAG